MSVKAAVDADRRLQEMADKQEIYDVLTRYCRGVDRMDADLINSVYHPGAIDSHFGTDSKGIPRTVPDIGKFFVELVKGREVCRHCVSNVSIRLDGEVADCESYFRALIVKYEGGEAVVIHSDGRYVDRFERRHGEWRIARRIFIVEWTSSERIPQAPPRAGIRSLRSREDISYRRLEEVPR